MPTVKQDMDFREKIIPSYILDNAIVWIRDNMKPEEIFPITQIREAAERNKVYDGGVSFMMNEIFGDKK